MLAACALVGLPAGARAAGPDTSGAPQAIAFLNQQREANGIPAFTATEASLATSWCPAESQGPVTESRVLAGGSDPVGFTAGSSPWSAAPLHQILMYDPLARSAGWATMTNAPFDGGPVVPYLECMGFGDEAPAPAATTAYTFFSELGPDAVPPSVDVQGEGPFAPQQLAGISQGTPTGPQPIFYVLGVGQVRAVSWSLTDRSTGSAVPGVSLVDSYDAQSDGYDPTIMWNSAVMIPPVLQPGTIYDGQARFTGDGGTCVTESFAFATLQSDGSPLGASVPRPSVQSCSATPAPPVAPPPPRVDARWRHGVLVVRSALGSGERLVVRARGRLHRTRRGTLRLRGRYTRSVIAWATRQGRSSRHVRIRVRRVRVQGWRVAVQGRRVAAQGRRGPVQILLG
ncbi:MAG TPA: hypothetical protein VFP55_09575 [Solirubrobacteraceae bacterium]|nr:hypothetical protein [Solirubrobacteraceae bacterium]